MVNNKPEKLGQSLTENLDIDAVYNESSGSSLKELLPEIQKSFTIRFNENQQNIQDNLLAYSRKEFQNSNYINLDDISKEFFVQQINLFTRDANVGFINSIIKYDTIELSDLPNHIQRKYYDFDEEKVEYYYNNLDK